MKHSMFIGLDVHGRQVPCQIAPVAGRMKRRNNPCAYADRADRPRDRTTQP